MTVPRKIAVMCIGLLVAADALTCEEAVSLGNPMRECSSTEKTCTEKCKAAVDSWMTKADDLIVGFRACTGEFEDYKKYNTTDYLKFLACELKSMGGCEACPGDAKTCLGAHVFAQKISRECSTDGSATCNEKCKAALDSVIAKVDDLKVGFGACRPPLLVTNADSLKTIACQSKSKCGFEACPPGDAKTCSGAVGLMWECQGSDGKTCTEKCKAALDLVIAKVDDLKVGFGACTGELEVYKLYNTTDSIKITACQSKSECGFEACPPGDAKTCLGAHVFTSKISQGCASDRRTCTEKCKATLDSLIAKVDDLKVGFGACPGPLQPPGTQNDADFLRMMACQEKSECGFDACPRVATTTSTTKKALASRTVLPAGRAVAMLLACAVTLVSM